MLRGAELVFTTVLSKLAQLKAAFAAGDTATALRIAAKFPRLGEHAGPITRGWAAYSNPDFYRQIGQDPHTLVAAGLDALRDKYRLERNPRFSTEGQIHMARTTLTRTRARKPADAPAPEATTDTPVAQAADEQPPAGWQPEPDKDMDGTAYHAPLTSPRRRAQARTRPVTPRPRRVRTVVAQAQAPLGYAAIVQFAAERGELAQLAGAVMAALATGSR